MNASQSTRHLADSAPTALFEGEPDGRVVWANDRWRATIGATVNGDQRLLSRHPKDRPALMAARREVRKPPPLRGGSFA